MHDTIYKLRKISIISVILAQGMLVFGIVNIVIGNYFLAIFNFAVAIFLGSETKRSFKIIKEAERQDLNLAIAIDHANQELADENKPGPRY